MGLSEENSDQALQRFAVQENQENPSEGLDGCNAERTTPPLAPALPTNLGRLLSDEEMGTLRSRCEGYMAPGANFQVPIDNEPPPPDFSNVNPQVWIERDKRPREDPNVKPSQRKA